MKYLNYNKLRSRSTMLDYGKFFIRILTMLVLLEFSRHVNSRFEFTNLQCKSLNKNLTKVEACLLKSMNRTYKHATVKLDLFRNTSNISGRVIFMKRLNGYKPFLYNFTVDCCNFIKSKRSRISNKLVNFFFGLFGPYSNVNHSCPYTNFIADKVPISHLDYQLSQILPLPNGVYRIATSWSTCGIAAVDILIDFVKD